MSRIVILDGHTLSPGGSDPTWAAFESLGSVSLFDRTPPHAVISRLRDAGADVAITNKVVIDREVMEACPTLRYVGVTATGMNCVDLAAATEHSITVTNVPGYAADSVAQHVFALLLELSNHVGAHDAAVRAGRWTGGPDWSFTVAPMWLLRDRVLGIVGLGAIGKQVARLGAAFGMHIAAAHQSSMDRVKLPGIDVRWLPVDELFAEADVLTLHCPLTDATRHLVNADRLKRMKRSAVLINTGRGDLVDEPALAAALREGGIAGAGLDVLSAEPPAEGHPLVGLSNCRITPHNAWAAVESRRLLMRIAADNLRAFLQGEPRNVVNP